MKNGGQAFPAGLTIQKDLNSVVVNTAQQGMTLRDYFAGQYLCNRWVEHGNSNTDIKCAAIKAYQIANAMILEREKTS